ncbi:MAG: hypothetical protein AAFP84_21805, partial [Actinomycetota bacterium]
AARPFSIGPATIADLVADPPVGPNCRHDAIDTFATRIEMFDEASSEPDSPAPKVAIIGADPSATVCSTDSTGRWRFSRPDGGPDSNDAVEVEGPSIVSIEADGEVFIQGGRPSEECTASEGSRFCDFQWVLFSTPPDADGTGSPTREWHVRAINYCTVDPDCPDTIGAWTSEKLAVARREVLPPLGIVFVGGWLTALGVALNRRRLARVLSWFVENVRRPTSPAA